MKFFLSKISIILFLFLIFHFSFFISPAFAQSKNEPTHSANSGQANYPAPNTNPDVPNNLHNWTQNVMIEVMSALTCQLAGVDPINPKQGCLGVDSASGKIGFLPSPQTGGAIGFMGNMIATLYTPPLHIGDYFQNLAQNFGINKKAYAQSPGGTGFQGLTPLIGIWSAFRNIVYLILVIIFVVIGLAIMLRIKIDPRTVMSIQNQIPKIIIGILLVTFSYAIAGFLIDLMWVLIFLIYESFLEIGADVHNFNPANIQGQAVLKVAGHLQAGGLFGITSSVASSVRDLVLSLLGIGGVGGLTRTLLAIFTVGISELPYLIPYLIILIAILVALFRLWFTLIMAYVYVLIDVVLAPFWIMGSLVPGSPINVSGWLRDLGANLLAFPATIAMFLLGKVFVDAFGKCPATDPNCSANNFVPPLIGNPGDMSTIGPIIGLGIILMTPNVVNMLKTALKAPKIDTGGVGKALGVGVGTPGRLIGGAGSTALSPHYDKAGKLVYPGGTMGRFLRGFGFVK